jgi:hypothetical protein
MKKGSTLFLKVVVLLIAIGVLTGLIWFPQAEGRAVNLDLISIYTDPFIIYSYIASIPFFVALYQAIKLLGLVEQNRVFSQIAVKILQNIKYCAILFIVFIVGAMPQIIKFADYDDAPGVTMMGLVVIFTSTVIATGVAVFQKLLQNAVDIKSENDLTV